MKPAFLQLPLHAVYVPHVSRTSGGITRPVTADVRLQSTLRRAFDAFFPEAKTSGHFPLPIRQEDLNSLMQDWYTKKRQEADLLKQYIPARATVHPDCWKDPVMTPLFDGIHRFGMAGWIYDLDGLLNFRNLREASLFIGGKTLCRVSFFPMARLDWMEFIERAERYNTREIKLVRRANGRPYAGVLNWNLRSALIVLGSQQ